MTSYGMEWKSVSNKRMDSWLTDLKPPMVKKGVGTPVLIRGVPNHSIEQSDLTEKYSD